MQELQGVLQQMADILGYDSFPGKPEMGKQCVFPLTISLGKVMCVLEGVINVSKHRPTKSKHMVPKRACSHLWLNLGEPQTAKSKVRDMGIWEGPAETGAQIEQQVH